MSRIAFICKKCKIGSFDSYSLWFNLDLTECLDAYITILLNHKYYDFYFSQEHGFTIIGEICKTSNPPIKNIIDDNYEYKELIELDYIIPCYDVEEVKTLVLKFLKLKAFI